MLYRIQKLRINSRARGRLPPIVLKVISITYTTRRLAREISAQAYWIHQLYNMTKRTFLKEEFKALQDKTSLKIRPLQARTCCRISLPNTKVILWAVCSIKGMESTRIAILNTLGIFLLRRKFTKIRVSARQHLALWIWYPSPRNTEIGMITRFPMVIKWRVISWSRRPTSPRITFRTELKKNSSSCCPTSWGIRRGTSRPTQNTIPPPCIYRPTSIRRKRSPRRCSNGGNLSVRTSTRCCYSRWASSTRCLRWTPTSVASSWVFNTWRTRSPTADSQNPIFPAKPSSWPSKV